MFQLAIVSAVALLCSLAATPLLIRLADTLQLYDEPVGGRRIHTRRTPRVGGVAVYLGFLAGFIAFAVAGQSSPVPEASRGLFMGLLGGGTVLFAAGLIDDLRGLRPLDKLAAQFTAAIIAFLAGFRLETISLGTVIELDLGWLALPATVLWIVAVTNAFNLIDGLDGLAAGLGLVALVATLSVAALLGRPDVMILCACMIGALLGFLRYNFNPASIFLGDSGSLFVGFFLAVVTVVGAQAASAASAVLILVPLSVLALPLVDTFLTVLRRWLRGVPVAAADRRHVHHQLLLAGFSARGAVCVMYCVAGLVAAFGTWLALTPPGSARWTAAMVALIGVLLSLAALQRLGYHEFLTMGRLILAAPSKVRKVLSDRINAGDLAEALEHAESMEQVDSLLSQAVLTFGFGHMELRRLGADPEKEATETGDDCAIWKLDYPLGQMRESGEPLVLRIWCPLDQEFRPYGAERVSGIIGPAIAARLREQDVLEPLRHPDLGLRDAARPSRVGMRAAGQGEVVLLPYKRPS